VRRIVVRQLPTTISCGTLTEVERLFPITPLLGELIVKEAARIAGVATQSVLRRCWEREERTRLCVEIRAKRFIDVVVGDLKEAPLGARCADSGYEVVARRSEVDDWRGV
jgi:hypothetical protein